MTSLFRSGRGGGAYASGGTVVIEGLVPLQRALKRSEGNLDRHLKRRLREAAEPVRQAAKGFAPKKSGALEGSIKIGVNQRSVSVYSNLAYAHAQEEGAWVAGRGPHISRGSASHYMSRAVTSRTAVVNQRIGEVLDDLADDFES